MSAKRAVVVYHGHCFDGMASAALLTQLLRAEIPSLERLHYVGLDHQPGGSHVPPSLLSGDVNGVVDFRYCPSDMLHWWFDHHATGVVGDDERTHLESNTAARVHFDPSYSSCAKLLFDVCRDHYGLRLDGAAELVHWADKLDTAGFASADEASSLEAPALAWSAVIERHGSTDFMGPRISKLAEGARVADLLESTEVAPLIDAIRAQQEIALTRIKSRASVVNAVIVVDLVEGSLGDERYPKFAPYGLYPDADYCVVVSRGKSRSKVSVGWNPWSPRTRHHDISAICARYGGGGHAVVGAVSLAASDHARARVIANEIVAHLGAIE